MTKIVFNLSYLDEYNDTDYSDFEDNASPCHQDPVGLNKGALISTYSAVCFLSLLGNTLVIYVVCSMKRRRTSTDVYLMHLAVADLLFSLTLPFWAVYINSQWIFGTFMCKLLSGLQEATFYGGVLLLACISVDRYLAIVKATQVISQKRHLVGVVCGGVWLGAGLLSLPILVQREAFEAESSGELVCHENLTAETMGEWRVGVRVLRHTVGFFLPLAVMIFCYGFTMATLYRGRNSQKHKVMRVILCVVLAFVVCWLPNNVTVLVDTLMRGGLMEETCDFRNRVELALQATQVLAFLHCAVNPILYAFIGQKFRNQLLSALFKHGLISKKVLSTYRRGSIHSSNSRNTSVTL
ncbi:C-X-C chemokine receptor type 1-like [Megalops cyprinoides]|uniref:C-X-C chemokine receptor type 1-like n=1 Tax=Megalops cyprinoides TaxID=118141 RepID=UPI001864969A|nr:C-X-C chemokine receptor type 1-like [Megalops cyprinoides]